MEKIMAKRIPYINDAEFVILENHESILNQCDEGDVCISRWIDEKKGIDGWSVTFVGKNGQLDGFDTPYDSPEEAIEQIKSNL
jgi:hypothetical protein